MTLSHEFSHPADRVWALIADFGHMPWMVPWLENIETSGQGIGMTRTMYWQHSKSPRVQRLEALDEKTMTLAFSSLDPLLPVSNFHIQHSVEKLTESRCRLHTRYCFDAESPAVEQEVAELLGQYAEQMENTLDAYLQKHPAP